MKTILIGYGEIGKAVYEIFSPCYPIEICEINSKPKGKYEAMLVAIPYNEDFVKTVKEYQEEYKPRLTIIFSTVAIGTCRQLEAIHSPVEGKHPDLAQSIIRMRRWIGGEDPLALEYFEGAGFNDIEITEKPEHTEWLKLRSTSKYGINLEWTRYEKSVCDDLEMPFYLVQDFDRDYNSLYEEMELFHFQRYILEPPEGNIGGHCVVPNAEILNKQYPSVLLEEITRDKS